jgi:hypoxanthine phosphoribosyltransferase
MKKIFCEWDTIDDLVNTLAKGITNNMNDIKYIHGLSRGGLIPAVMLSHKLNIPYTPHPELFAPWQLLIVDDIADSGKTLQRYKEYQTAVLHYKPHTSLFTPDIWATKHKGDEWIIYPWESEDSKTIQDYKLDN